MENRTEQTDEDKVDLNLFHLPIKVKFPSYSRISFPYYQFFPFPMIQTFLNLHT